MKTTHSLPRIQGVAFGSMLFLATVSYPSFGADTDLADVPLAEASTVEVLPNIMFVLDDSGSMDWDYMPDYVSSQYCRGTGSSLTNCYAGDPPYYMNAFNGVYYNPMVNYTPPKNWDGTDKTNYTTWTAVPNDGYGVQASGTTNLTSNYPERVACSDNWVDINGSSCKSQIDSSNNYSYPDSTYDTVRTRYGAPFYYTATVEWCKNRASNPNPRFGNSNCQARKDATYQYVKYSNWKRVNIVSSTNSYPGPNGTTRTYAEEMTNFANWYAWYRTRMQMMKTATGQTFVNLRGQPDTSDPTDKNYLHGRVGFSTINEQGVSNNYRFLGIDYFSGTHKQTWFTRLYAINPTGGTPLLGALSKAGRIYAGKIGTDPVQYSCQRNFTILSSDGFWNSTTSTYGPTKENGTTVVGDQDGVSGVTRPSYDASKTANTLADVAYYYYHTDLRTGNCAVCTNNVTPVGTKADEDDVAQHQHMTTFTVGLGVDGRLAYQEGYKTSTTGDYVGLKQGTIDWPAPVASTDDERKIDDMWHAAVNGRGTYFSARDPESLVKGLTSALGSIESTTGSGAAAATSSLEPTQGDNAIYIANYRTVYWDGELSAHSIDLNTGSISSTTTWKAAGNLDNKIGSTGDSDTRTIYTSTNSSLVNYAYSNLSSAQQAYFNNNQLSQYVDWTDAEKGVATNQLLFNFTRGQNRYEDQERTESYGTYSRLYRDRETTLGDVVHSQPVYVKAPMYNFVDTGYFDYKTSNENRASSVYLAANDGMLHAFNAGTGEERWAYVPPMVMENLWRLADKDYSTNHRFFIDGPITVTDIAVGSTWKTILIGAMGKGGRGYYALDITNPSSPSFLWKYSADENAKMGYTYGAAQVTKVNGAWVALLPSGYNNVPENSKYATADGKGYLFMVNAATGELIRTIATGAGSTTTPSGLAKINIKVESFTANNTSDTAYGGDLLGNLWRFNLTGGTASKLIDLGTNQSITTTPEIGKVEGNTVIYFGTGRYLGQSDLNDNSTQAIYGIKDSGNEVSKSDLVQQTITGTDISSNTVAWGTDSGWYLNLPDSKERVHIDPKLVLGTLVVASTIPEASECQPGGYSHLFMLDSTTGSGVGEYQAIFNYVSPIVGLSIFKLPDGTIKVVAVTADGKIPSGEPPSLPIGSSGSGGADNGKRVMWRELLE